MPGASKQYKNVCFSGHAFGYGCISNCRNCHTYRREVSPEYKWRFLALLEMAFYACMFFCATIWNAPSVINVFNTLKIG